MPPSKSTKEIQEVISALMPEGKSKFTTLSEQGYVEILPSKTKNGLLSWFRKKWIWAKALLDINFSEDVESNFNEKLEQCSNCRSANIINYTKGKKLAFLLWVLLGVPLFSYKHGKKCLDCGYFK